MSKAVIQPEVRPILPIKRVSGVVRVPGDKSIAHRALILGAAAEGETVIHGVPDGEDVGRTISALRQLGCRVVWDGNRTVRIQGPEDGDWTVPPPTLDCGNSGTTLRLLSGLLAGLGIGARLTGDGSLQRRPMHRLIEPLEQMGTVIRSNEGHPPLHLVPVGRLNPQSIEPWIPSAQVKTAVLLAGLFGVDGETTVTERFQSRDHTERLLPAFGIEFVKDGLSVRVQGPTTPKGAMIDVPGDFSSAAPFLVAAILAPEGELRLEGVGVNPTRTGLLDILRDMGAEIVLENERETPHGEPVADLVARASKLAGIEVSGELALRAIDELPLVAVAGALASGTTRIRDAAELKVKECDRIASITQGLRAMGAEVRATSDGFEVEGLQSLLQGADLHGRGDHRMVMALTVAASLAEGESRIQGSGAVGMSYPAFFEDFEEVTRG